MSNSRLSGQTRPAVTFHVALYTPEGHMKRIQHNSCVHKYHFVNPIKAVLVCILLPKLISVNRYSSLLKTIDIDIWRVQYIISSILSATTGPLRTFILMLPNMKVSFTHLPSQKHICFCMVSFLKIRKKRGFNNTNPCHIFQICLKKNHTKLCCNIYKQFSVLTIHVFGSVFWSYVCNLWWVSF